MSKKLVYLAAVCLTFTVAGSAGAQVGQGKVLFEYWLNIGGGTAIADLTGNANFPDNPTSSEWRDSFKSKVDWADNMGTRARAFLTPPQDGDYTFWVCGDDACQLWLSTDEDPANAVKIAEVTGWTPAENWDGSGGSTDVALLKSAPIALKAGQSYYIEGLMKEGGGGDSITAGWAGPGIGDTVTVIAGKYLRAFIRDPEPLFKAQNPDPANGAVDVTSPLFQWTASATAVMHEVYFGTSPELGAADDRGPAPVAMYFHLEGLTPGTTYYWRVDETDAAGVVTQGDVWSFTAMPLTAHAPTPADAAVDVKLAGSLKWVAGQSVMGHMVYLGADKALVEAGDASVQVGAGPEVKYDYTGLLPFTTYYWRVDEIGSTGEIIPGPVWSFSTVTFLSLGDAVTLNYNNSAEPFTSQVELTGAADWTAYGMSDLVVQFTGRPASFTQTDTGITVIAAGADIYNAIDEFCYVCKKLTGDGSITVRVDRLDLTNAWAKAGVMIRESLSPVVKQVHTIVSGSNGIEFQYRPTAGVNTTQFATTGGTPPLPQWVRLTRQGNTFTGEYSSDGQTWTKITSGASTSVQDLVMGGDVYIGLAVTSHVAGTKTTAQFSNITTTGDVSGDWLGFNIAGNQPGNSPADLYAAVEDTAGQLAVVNFGDPAATQIAQPWTWKIPLSSFAGVDLKNVAKLYLGAGDLLNPVASGGGTVTFSSVRVVRPVVLVKGADVTMPGDNVLGVPNDGVNAGGSDAGWPAAETPWLAIDDNVNKKFLHFKGEKEPTGFQVEVLAGPTVVTGLTLTTANDAPERDPVAFELSGSNDGFQGPWTLIATGDIVDFAGATAWPRYTKNATPIVFENTVAYKFYQVMFTAVRNPAAANSMQIGEVELINGAPNIVWVTDAWDDDADGITDDRAWVDLLQANGYAVDYRLDRSWRTLDEANLSILNAADLVIVSRNFNSGDYNNGNERDQWNSVTAPLMLMSMHAARSSHWKWLNTTTIPNAAPAMQPVDAAHPAFTGVTLDANGQVQALVVAPDMNTSFPGTADVGNGTLIATRADTGEVWIAMWDAGVEFYPGAGQIPAGPRVFFAAGTQEVPASGVGRGELNLTDSGQAVFLNLVDLLLGRLEVAPAQVCYTYEGDTAAAGAGETTEAGTSLDGTWSNENGSDAWDGTAPGAGAPGGAGVFVEDDVTFLRIQDTGDPRDYGLSDPSNRKVYFQHPITSGLDGAHLEIRIRVATTGVLDPVNPDGGAGITPWPAAGIGMHIRDDGKGMFGAAEAGVGIISFSLAKAGEIAGLETDALVMNNLIGASPSADVDTGEAATAVNTMTLADATQWNTIVIDIAAGGTGTHVVTVSVNGGAPQSFDVTAGTGVQGTVNYITLGSSGTTPSTALDVDYFRICE